MSGFRIDLYSNPHKELRNFAFEASMLASQTDFTNAGDLEKLNKSLANMIQKFRAHARSESTYAHPILARKMPGVYKELEAAHVEHHDDLNQLEALFQKISTEQKEQRQALGLEFYRALNRFIAEDLHHMNEEEYSMQNIWELFNASELFAIMVSFKKIEEPENFDSIMRMVDANLSPAEKTEMYAVIKECHGDKILTQVLS